MIHEFVSIVIIIVVCIVYVEVKKIFIRKKLRHFETPKQYPIIGVAGRLIGKTNEQLIEVALNLFDEVKTTPFQMWVGPVLMIGVSEPRDIQTVLTSDNCLNKPYFYDLMRCKTSIIATKREIWKPNRRALNCAFNMNMLQSYVPLLNQKAHILLKQMQQYETVSGDLYRTIFIAMMDMVAKTTMGSELNLQVGRGPHFYKIAKKIMNNIQYRLVRVWLRWDFTYSMTQVGRDEKAPLKDGNGLFDEMYEKKLQEYESLHENGVDYLKEAKENNATNFLDKCFLLENEGIFTHENVLDQMRVIVLAGIDTSSITVFGTLLMLAMNPEHQERVVDELRSVFDTEDCDVTLAHLNDLKYTERAIKETMRLIPPVPFIARKTSADIELEKGIIPNNTLVIINIMRMHRNPQIWGENVLEFDPDRFLPENVAKRPPYSYIPFSAGPRNCIGMKYAMMSAKITLSFLLRRYKFSSDLKFHEIRLNTHLVTEVTNENPLLITNRQF